MILMVGNQIARNIKFFRNQNEWTQDKLAEKLLTSRSAISKWEGNIYTPDIHSLLKLTNFFKISLEDLISMESFQHDILKDSRLKYTSDPNKFDQEVSQIVEYIIKNPTLKQELFRMPK